ncbi:MAG: septal ring lytic transglycosylase RlpA family protein [Rhodospirillales bacterium]|nr:septal ring lytic transglycosylase RlpA family protein [Rhodospirillales bacterium]
MKFEKMKRTHFGLLALCLLSVSLLSACAQTQLGAHLGKDIYNESTAQGTFKVGNPYDVQGLKYTPKETYYHTENGVASWYGPGFHGKKTANGEVFNKYDLTAAHRTLQMPSLIEVTNLSNGKKAVLRVNDRGPFARSRILDVSEHAAEVLGFKNQGTANIQLRVLTEESKELADIAKSGKSTRGMEVAYNQGKKPISRTHLPASQAPVSPMIPAVDPTAAQAQVASVTRQELIVPEVSSSAIEPSSGVEVAALSGAHAPSDYAQSKIYIQAGAFGNSGNAQALSGRLGSIAPANVSPVNVNGSLYHRVKVGPFQDMAQARSALSQIAAAGQTDARIFIE